MNTARASHPEARRPAEARGEHGNLARGGDRAPRGDVRGGDRRDFRNASYRPENLHGGRAIPEGRFHASFGSAHQFHIGHPIMIGGQASFHFGGFWFGLVDPWPVAWAYSDPVYIDYVDGGYALVDVLHPGVQVAVSAGDPAPDTCPATDNTDTPAPAAQVATVTMVRPVTVAYVPFYSYFTWHYWRPYWHHYWR